MSQLTKQWLQILSNNVDDLSGEEELSEILSICQTMVDKLTAPIAIDIDIIVDEDTEQRSISIKH